MRATITFPDDLARRLSREAEERQTSFAALIRDLVARALSERPERPRKIPFANLFDDPDMAGERMDEMLSERWADAIDRDRG